MAGMPLPHVSSRRVLACLLALLFLPQAFRCYAQTWREVQSPHFRVVTDGSEREGRDVAKEFEQMRSVFTMRFNNPVLETGAPLLVVAVREPGLHTLTPGLWKDRDRVAGEFFRGWEHQFALVRLDAFGDLNQAVVFHEYTHSVMHANVHWLPTWLDEGMAEFYAYTRFQSDKIYVGAPSVRLRHLQNASLIPITEMLSPNTRSITKDEARNDLFYAEAWAMVHLMILGKGMDGGAKLSRFIALLQTETPQLEAFQQIFGDPTAFEKQLSTVISQFTISAGVLPPGQAIDAKSFQVRVLNAAETNYALGLFDIGAHDSGEGKKRLEAAEAADPALAGPHEEIGFLAWRQGDDQQAKSEWEKAISLDPSSYRSAFALLMTGTPLNQQTKAQLNDTRQALEALHAKAPSFAPPLVELALIDWRTGQMNQAYKSAVQAEKLEPWRAGYHLLTGYILLQGRQPAAAAEHARLVAARWPGSDHDEAVDLWNQVPPSARTDGPALTMTIPPDATAARGTIVSTSCGKEGLNLVLQPDTPGKSPVTVVAKGPFESGFSDTLWFGEDHYTPCFHLAERPAFVAWKTDAGTNALRVLEVRDDLPQLELASASANTSATAASNTSKP